MVTARRRIGTSLCLAGAALLTYASGSYLQGAIARDRARTEWDRNQARGAVRTIAAALETSSAAGTSVRPGAPLARLQIPSLELDEIVVEGVRDAQLNAGPGHLPGSALPGEPGNSVISAHRDRHFHGLDRVELGDTVVTETQTHRVTWVVIARRVVGRAEPALFATDEATLTLTTCWPVRYVGPAPDRLLLSAIPVARTPRS